MSVAAILLAAGAGTRMRGADKLTEDVRGRPLLRDRVQMLLESHAHEVIVVVSEDHPARLGAIADLGCRIFENADAASGMASSISCGVTAVSPDASAALIMPADMPEIEAEDINRLISYHLGKPRRVTRATAQDGTPGSPVVFPRAFFADLLALRGEESGRDVLKAHSDAVDHVALPGSRATLDLDTPEAWAAWRAAAR